MIFAFSSFLDQVPILILYQNQNTQNRLNEYITIWDTYILRLDDKRIAGGMAGLSSGKVSTYFEVNFIRVKIIQKTFLFNEFTSILPGQLVAIKDFTILIY